VSILLQTLDATGKAVDYYALDLSLKELRRTLEELPAFGHVKCHGLHGTYDDGLNWLKLPENQARPKCVMSLGSSIGQHPVYNAAFTLFLILVGNFSRHEAASFLRGFSEALQLSDSMLIGLDATDDPAKVL
jgi:L-histidine Nalpha-methyltransferase / hercynylcysteine S-oxide synthase